MTDADDGLEYTIEPKRDLYKQQEGAQAMVRAYALYRFGSHPEISRMFLFGDITVGKFGYFLLYLLK